MDQHEFTVGASPQGKGRNRRCLAPGPQGRRAELSPDNYIHSTVFIAVPCCARVKAVRAFRNQTGSGPRSIRRLSAGRPLHLLYESGGLTTVAFLAPAKRGVANTRWDVGRVIVPPTDLPRAVQPFDACTFAGLPSQVQGKLLRVLRAAIIRARGSHGMV